MTAYLLMAALSYFGLFLLMVKVAGIKKPRTVVRVQLAARRRRAQMRYVKGGRDY